MDFRDHDVVVTGGTGALGGAVVAALVAAGAVCHVPYVVAAEAERFPLRDHTRVKLMAGIDLTDEAAVTRLYQGAGNVWASIHLAGGFAMSAVGATSKADLMKQVEMNFVTAFLCCRAALDVMRAGGRIVNVAARRRHGGLHGEQGRGRGAHSRTR